ncbi:T9SS type A sorting domain-containing protein [Flavobacterium sp.]|uniref:DUF7619 domain-containing protein n=1 Tax=Flavobacterium sp. TaxID=239 RepID=UPI0035ADF080
MEKSKQIKATITKNLFFFLLFLTGTTNAQIVNIPDANFKDALLQIYGIGNAKDINGNDIKIDSNLDGEIQESEAQNVYQLWVDGFSIYNLTGIEAFVNLEFLECSTNILVSLDLSQNINLNTIDCKNNQLTYLNVSQCIGLINLNCSENQLSSLDISQNPNLITLNCENNQLVNLDVSQNINLTSLYFNDLSTTFDFSQNTSLINLRYASPNLDTINLSNNINLVDLTVSGGLTSLDISNNINLTDLNCSVNQLVFLDLSQNVNLINLFCSFNQLTSLDISNNINLLSLSVEYNQLTSLDTSNNINLLTLYVENNQLSVLNVSNNINLQYLTCENNLLVTLDLTHNSNLEYMSLGNVGLTSLSLNQNTHLHSFYCHQNDLTFIDFSQMPNLISLSINGGLLQNIDLSNNNEMNVFTIGDMPNLQSIFMKNSSPNELVLISSCPNLRFVCSRENQIEMIQLGLAFYGLTNVTVNSYCSFTPGGNYNTITGNVKFDADNNGCDATDLPHPNIRVNINDGTNTGASFTNNTGNYTFYTQAGNFTLTPSIENPSWFTFSPLSAAIPFANNDNNIATQDFCFTANGVHNDLEVIIVPIIPARPGFEAVYKIVYRNKGNQTLSQQYGINFFYNQNLMQFVSSSVSTSQSGNGSLSWDYTGLQPFESRAILITFLINAPTDNVPVNIGDELTFTTSIMPQAGDENTLDNLFQLNQTVVGSFDPNNIICIEGEVVPPTEIGNYLHYVVNFENTGTAPAENVVVKVVVNTTDFDMDSLQLMNTSHPVDARINGNVVEFIFQSINLDSGGHGNVLLKIKSKNNLQQGDVVEKKADIYFDYNFPIATNDYETTFQLLSSPDVAIDNSISIYPNPARNNVNIHCNNTMKTIELYDVQGRVLQSQVIDSQSSNMDISSKSKGVYFLKVVTEKGIKVEKLVKN